MVHGGGLEAISKKNLVPLGKSPMTNETYVLIGERPKFRVVILSESATCQKKEISYLKVGHFWPYGQNRPTWASDISGYKHTNIDVKCLLESPYLPLQNEILHFYVAYI